MAHGIGIAFAHVEMPFARGLLLWQRCRTLVMSVVGSFDALVSRLELQPHPEGGWYREVQRSSIQVIRPDGQQRSAITTVLFLLGAEDVSRCLCVLVFSLFGSACNHRLVMKSETSPSRSKHPSVRTRC